jgi:tRNA-2-methylthio-N6-dimethylallyladenosine synthase
VGSENIQSGSVYIETYGCQMNLVDSEIVMSMLEERGYTRAEKAEDAAIIFVNTCAVREHAVTKVVSNINNFKPLKTARPSLRVGVLGCLSKHAGERIAKEIPFIDWILGPNVYRKLPELLLQPSPKSPQIVTEEISDELYDDILPSRREGINAWVTITRGCNNHCTYCVVPGARGSERHRSPESIIREVEDAVSDGFVQITLLGQNVNSYSFENEVFADVLEKVASVDGIKRVRFMTSHPKDCSERLLEVMGTNPKVCPELHLPFQAGSDRILRKMNRKYTSKHYLNLVEKARKLIPDLLLSTDIIVGFPDETDDDYQETVKLVEHVGYDNAFVYKYSERPNTPAAKLEDNVPDDVKGKRLVQLNEIIRESGVKNRLDKIGQTYPILVEGFSSKSSEEYMGRTSAGYIVVFSGDAEISQEVDVKIAELSGLTLRGKTV